jgi:hypothetical protein
MGLFSTRKASVQSSVPSFYGPSTSEQDQFQYDKTTAQLHPLPGEQSSFYNYAQAPIVPLDSPRRTRNESINQQFSPPPSRPTRPTTATSQFSIIPKLTPKPTNKKERPPSAASRVFFSSGRPITADGKLIQSPPPGSRQANTVSLPTDISATNLRSAPSIRSRKVKSLDLLKSNPRLKYLAPETPPLVLSKGKEAERELQFKHDGRGLFASKTVANLADDLDTRALRKLLERDSKRYGRYRSSDELRNKYSPRQDVPGEIPQSQGSMEPTDENDGVIDWEGRFDRFGTPIISTPDPGMSTLGLSTIRAVPRSREPSEELLGSGHFDQDSFRLPEHQPRRESEATIRPRRQQPNLPPILLFGKDRNTSPTNQQHQLTKEETPIILLGPNSAQSYETASTQPLYDTSFPQPFSSPRTHAETTPIQLLSQPLSPPPLRPPILSYPTETTQEEYETAEEYTVSSDNASDETEEEWHDSPVIPREKQPKAPWLADLPTPRPSSPESETSHTIDFADSEPDYEEGIFPAQNSMWGESPIIGLAIPGGPRTDSPAESEGSWLSQRLDIENAVRKSFGSPTRRATPPIILESSPLPGAGLGKLDVIAAAAMNARAWAATQPDYEGNEYGEDEGYELATPQIAEVERVRQGSMVRMVEVLDSPNVEGVIGRVSNGESPEYEIGKENGGILLF